MRHWGKAVELSTHIQRIREKVYLHTTCIFIQIAVFKKQTPRKVAVQCMAPPPSSKSTKRLSDDKLECLITQFTILEGIKLEGLSSTCCRPKPLITGRDPHNVVRFFREVMVAGSPPTRSVEATLLESTPWQTCSLITTFVINKRSHPRLIVVNNRSIMCPQFRRQISL